MTTQRWGLAAIVALALVIFGGSGWAAAQQSPTDDATKAVEKSVSDPYAVPDGFEDLLLFVKRISSRRPTTAEEARELQTKGGPAVQEAIAKLKKIATGDERKRPEYADALAMDLSMRSGEIARASAEEQRQAIDEAKSLLALDNMPNTALNAAQMLAMNLEFGGQPEMAAQAYRELGAMLATKNNAEARSIAEKMTGAARRMTLIGQPLELTGTLIDGAPFDWAKYRGRVVLVDFWATWCGPCIGELPNVKKNYANFHDRGFDVVGISLDRDRQKLDEFLATEKLPWVTVHDGDWALNRVAQYYGIMGIPTVLLVDKEGKVVSLNARGPVLTRELEKLLGPATPGEDSTGAKAD